MPKSRYRNPFSDAPSKKFSISVDAALYQWIEYEMKRRDEARSTVIQRILKDARYRQEEGEEARHAASVDSAVVALQSEYRTTRELVSAVKNFTWWAKKNVAENGERLDELLARSDRVSEGNTSSWMERGMSALTREIRRLGEKLDAAAPVEQHASLEKKLDKLLKVLNSTAVEVLRFQKEAREQWTAGSYPQQQLPFTEPKAVIRTKGSKSDDSDRVPVRGLTLSPDQLAQLMLSHAFIQHQFHQQASRTPVLKQVVHMKRNQMMAAIDPDWKENPAFADLERSFRTLHASLRLEMEDEIRERTDREVADTLAKASPQRSFLPSMGKAADRARRR